MIEEMEFWQTDQVSSANRMPSPFLCCERYSLIFPSFMQVLQFARLRYKLKLKGESILKFALLQDMSFLFLTLLTDFPASFKHHF